MGNGYFLDVLRSSVNIPTLSTTVMPLFRLSILKRRREFIGFVAGAVLVGGWGLGSLAATLTVSNTGDSGAGSLRQAILDANNTNGLDTIVFQIPGSGVHTIAPATALPDVTDQV